MNWIKWQWDSLGSDTLLGIGLLCCLGGGVPMTFYIHKMMIREFEGLWDISLFILCVVISFFGSNTILKAEGLDEI